MGELDKFEQKSIEWIEELDQALGYKDRRKTLAVLRAGMHALRDRLPPEEAIQLASELPLVLRGLYYEGYTLRGKPVKAHTKEQFLDMVRAELRADLAGDAERAILAVFELISRHVSAGEMSDVASDLPRRIAQFLRS